MIHKNQMPWRNVCCPKCLSDFNFELDSLNCSNESCKAVYPIIDGIPILINEDSSIFSFDDFSPKKVTFFKKRNKFFEWVIRHAPSISHNISAKRNYKIISNLALERSASPSVLIIGGGAVGEGLDVFVDNPSIELVETDVSFGSRVKLICDAHDLPFLDDSFDVVVVQAVLEHVVDPFSCVQEIYRVMKKGALVYAETPFMQQVHGGRYDFHRFTHRGHRRLLRRFREIESGITGGSGMALAWSWQYFLWSFCRSERARTFCSLIGRLTAFHLKYFDYYTSHNFARAYDAASGFYFIGSKDENVISDKSIVFSYDCDIGR